MRTAAILLLLWPFTRTTTVECARMGSQYDCIVRVRDKKTHKIRFSGIQIDTPNHDHHFSTTIKLDTVDLDGKVIKVKN